MQKTTVASLAVDYIDLAIQQGIPIRQAIERIRETATASRLLPQTIDGLDVELIVYGDNSLVVLVSDGNTLRYDAYVPAAVTLWSSSDAQH